MTVEKEFQFCKKFYISYAPPTPYRSKKPEEHFL